MPSSQRSSPRKRGANWAWLTSVYGFVQVHTSISQLLPWSRAQLLTRCLPPTLVCRRCRSRTRLCSRLRRPRRSYSRSWRRPCNRRRSVGNWRAPFGPHRATIVRRRNSRRPRSSHRKRSRRRRPVACRIAGDNIAATARGMRSDPCRSSYRKRVGTHRRSRRALCQAAPSPRWSSRRTKPPRPRRVPRLRLRNYLLCFESADRIGVIAQAAQDLVRMLAALRRRGAQR